MKIHFFNGAPHTSFKLFMSGFGVLPRAFNPTQSLAMVYDYRDFSNLDEIVCLAKDAQSLIAWSMGVAIASRIFTAPSPCLENAIAVNGTIVGVDSKFGIHPRLFKHTIEHLDTEAFARGCFGDCENYANFCEFLSPTQTLIEELQSLRDFCTTSLAYVPKWRKAFVSDNDVIFSPLAQNLAWELYAKTHEDFTLHRLAYPHFVFQSLKVF